MTYEDIDETDDNEEDESYYEGGQNYCDSYCDTCDREFYTYDKYQAHVSEHTVCGLDGCKFTAHEKIVQKHIEMQHKTGLYDKIKQLEDPKEIERWIQERKRNYPNKENIELRRQKQEEMIKRGEVLGQRKRKFGFGNKSRGFRDKNCDQTYKKQSSRRQNKQQNKVVKVKFQFDDKSDWNGNLPPFRGTSELYEEYVSDAFSDDEWLCKEFEGESTNALKIVNNEIKFNNALGALIGAYNSSDYSDEDEEIKKEPADSVSRNTDCIEVNKCKVSDVDISQEIQVNTKNSIKVENEEYTEETIQDVSEQNIQELQNEAPEEVKIEKIEEDIPTICEKKSETKLKTKTKRKRQCGRKKMQKKKLLKRPNADSFPNRHFKRRKLTLLEKLLEKDIIHERNVILQCVKYVVKRNFFHQPSEFKSGFK